MLTQRRSTARSVADAIADRLASPAPLHTLAWKHGWWPQSLAYGAAGVALLHIERARADLAPWQLAHDWLACAAHDAVDSGDNSHLFYGAPALTFVLHAAAADQPGRYAHALTTLDEHVATTTRSRLDRAHARIDRGGELPALAEFDGMRGLAGLGALLLLRAPHEELLRDVLSYLVRLTGPVTDGEERLPGWWSGLAPSGRASPEYPGGHGNNGMAHGIGGPLAILSLAALRGVTVAGQADAIRRICAWLDRWRHDGGTGPRWPYWITRAQLRRGQAGEVPLVRPSWCYGTAGLARAQQLAALATGDHDRQQLAEGALARSLSDPVQLVATTDLSLCHGFAGLAHIAGLAAADAATTELARCVPPLLRAIIPDPHAAPAALADSVLHGAGGDMGLLEGAAGLALALHAADPDTPPLSGWNSFLLIT